MWQIQPKHAQLNTHTHTHMLWGLKSSPFCSVVLLAHRWRTSWCDQQLSLSRVASWWPHGVVLPQCCPSGSAPHPPPLIKTPLYVHTSTPSWVTVMLLTDGGLPVNGSMLVGGVSQLARTLRPLCASPSDFCSHSWWNIFTVLTFRGKRQSYILSEQADKYILFQAGYWFSASL